MSGLNNFLTLFDNFFFFFSVGFYQGDMTRLLDDIAVLKPTVFPVVPRVMNRLYEKVF